MPTTCKAKSMPHKDQPAAQTNSLDTKVAHFGVLQHAWLALPVQLLDQALTDKVKVSTTVNQALDSLV